MKNKIFTSLFILVTGALIFYTCITKDPNPRVKYPKDTTDTRFPDGKNELSTIPGNNYFKTTLSGFSLWVSENTYMEFISESGKCDTASGNYIISMKSAGKGDSLSFISVFFKDMPTENKSFTFVPYNKVPLSDTSAWATITTPMMASTWKTWGAIKGKVNVEVVNGIANAVFDTARVQNLSNISDTTFKWMSGRVYCK